jgi:hypothetical protein
MTQTVEPVTLALTGMLPFGVIAGAVLAYPLGRGLLRVYHRSVARSMAQHAGAGERPDVPAAPAGKPAPGGALQLLDAGADAGSSPLLETSWRLAAAYAVAGAAFAVVMTAAWLVATRDATLPATKLLLLFWTYFWPAVLTVNLVAGVRRHHRLLLGGYFAVYAVLTAVALTRNPDMGWHELPLFWLVMNGPPTLLLAAFLTRRIRAVGPMVLAFTVIAVTGSQVPASILSTDDELLRRVAQPLIAAGLGGNSIFWGIMLAGLLAFALAGWFGLQWVGRRYRRKHVSDQMLTVESMWLMFGLVHSIGLVFEGWAWIFTGFAAFAAFVAARSAAFRVLRRAPLARPRRLLLLRVFALGRRSERLFDLLQKHWLRSGDIAMIAGPDLVTTTIEPHEFLDFLGRGVSRQFVKDRTDLAGRIAAMDTTTDPDLRYRVNEFFCHADTWQMTMRELATHSDAVLMDLRSFSAANQGCLFELGELLKTVDLRRVVFAIDATTDRGFLEGAMARLWQTVPAESPNRRQPQAAARLVDLGTRTDAPALQRLFTALA